jgi:hypothetical protein
MRGWVQENSRESPHCWLSDRDQMAQERMARLCHDHPGDQGGCTRFIRLEHVLDTAPAYQPGKGLLSSHRPEPSGDGPTGSQGHLPFHAAPATLLPDRQTPTQLPQASHFQQFADTFCRYRPFIHDDAPSLPSCTSSVGTRLAHFHLPALSPRGQCILCTYASPLLCTYRP